jgi:hypothetical protein
LATVPFEDRAWVRQCEMEAKLAEDDLRAESHRRKMARLNARIAELEASLGIQAENAENSAYMARIAEAEVR